MDVSEAVAQAEPVRRDAHATYLLAMICFVVTANSATQGYDSSMMVSNAGREAGR